MYDIIAQLASKVVFLQRSLAFRKAEIGKSHLLILRGHRSRSDIVGLDFPKPILCTKMLPIISVLGNESSIFKVIISKVASFGFMRSVISLIATSAPPTKRGKYIKENISIFFLY